MKIVSTPSEEFEYKFKCRNCKSVLIASIDDIGYGDFRGYCDDYADMRFYSTCLLCESDHIIPDSAINPIIQKKIRSKRS